MSVFTRAIACVALMVVTLSARSESHSAKTIAKMLKACGEAPLAAEPIHLWNETDEQRLDRMAWWTQARFGMFIHFGLYSLPGRHEWVKSAERLDNAAYEKYFAHFDPDRLDARAWVKWAKKAGMKYIVLTTKHHEGFCLFDSKLTDYKITNTKYGRDLVREYVEACRDEGLRVGFYYSLQDWHHADYPIDRFHPLRPTAYGPFDTKNVEGPEEPWLAANASRSMSRYRDYLYAQVTELLTNYGPIDLLWLDFTIPGKRTKHAEDWRSEDLVRLVRRLQPKIIINDRLGLGKTTLDGWDFITPEQRFPKPGEMDRFGRSWPWETCQTFSGSWGYHRDEKTWKTSAQCVELLIRAVAEGGNLVMNVGPTGRGDFDDRACERLDAYAKWMADNSRSIYGCTRAPAGFEAPKGTYLTYHPKANRLYLHLVDYPKDGHLKVAFVDRVEYAQFLNDSSEVVVFEGNFILPKDKPPRDVPVLELFLLDRPDKEPAKSGSNPT